MPEGNNNVNGGQTVTPRVAAQEAYIKNLMTGSENVPGMTEEQARAIANSNNDLFENWAMNHGFAEAFEETKIQIEDPFVPATEAFVRNLMTGSEGVPAISEIQARAIAADRGAVETWARNHGFAEAFDNFAKQNEQKDTLENARKAYIESLKSAGMSEEDAIKFANLDGNQDLFENWARNHDFAEAFDKVEDKDDTKLADARKAYIESLKSAGMSEEDAIKFANLDRNQDLFENWARNNGFAEAFDKAEDTKLADAKEAYIESLKSAGMSEEDAIKFANLDRNQDLFENWAVNHGFDNIFDDAAKDGQNPIQQDSEEVKPSAFATHLYADGNNPRFETLEDAMAYAAAHPELEESWKKDNEVQDKSKDEFDPSHALPAGDEVGFDPSHALPAGDEMPPASAQAGESKLASQNLKDRFKDFWKKHWSKIVTAAVALVVIGVTAAFIGDAVSAQTIQDAANMASQGDTSIFTQSVSDTINQAMQAVNGQSVPTEQVVQATQMYDPSVDPSQIFSDAYNASAGVNSASVDPSAGQLYTGDFFNPDTGQYAGVDTSNLTMDQVKQLGEQGYTVPLYTNDPSMMAADGNTIANANAATGFGGPTR